MIDLTLKQLKTILTADLIGDENLSISEINTDTRRFVADSLFFALKGERFDAHHYLPQAVSQGAVALVVERADLTLDVPQLVVQDTRLALGQLAAWLRQTLNPKVVAMTGSSGKTTVKEMAAAILSQSAVGSDGVLFTQGNFNNDIGVPLTLLRLTEKHRFAVIELGANHRGEIDYTTHLAMPDAALVNNVAPAHLEGFGSLLGVAQAKGEIYRGLTASGIAIINKAHDYAKLWAENIGNHPVQYFNAAARQGDFWAENIRQTDSGSLFTLCTPQGTIDIDLPYLGLHNIQNAQAAAALAMAVGASITEIKAGLETRSTVKGRLFPIAVNPQLLLLDDTYNANVDSLKAAVEVLKNYPAFRILAVGDMKELGENSAQCHQDVADAVQAAGLDLVLSFGQQSAVISAGVLGQHFTDKTALAAYAQRVIAAQLQQKQNVVLLAKGSRSMQMEEVINLLKDHFSC